MSRGVLAIGDSITRSCGFPVGNLPLAPWSAWVARALGEPIDTHAISGADSSEVRAAVPELRDDYRLALVYVGTNDLLRGRTPEAYADDAAALLKTAVTAAEVVLTFTLPLWVGYASKRRVLAFGDALRAAAPDGVMIVQAPEIHGPRFVAPDRVHPTAAGQLAFADAAAWRLRDEGWALPLPSSLPGAPGRVRIGEVVRWARGAPVAAAWAAARRVRA